MLPGLDALVRGAVLGLLVGPAAVLLCWRLAVGLAPKPRIALATLAGYGTAAALGLGYCLVFESSSYNDEALFGTLIIGGGAALLAALVLFLATLVAPGMRR